MSSQKAEKKEALPIIEHSGEKAYNLIKRPFISEKATLLTQSGQVVFLVEPFAAKPDIKRAVETLFKVKIKAVNIICQKGKEKRFRGVLGRRKNYKKAIITLEKGQNVEILTGARQ